MPSSSAARGRAAPARRQPLGRGFVTTPVRPERPVVAPFAAVFGTLTAAECLYVGFLLWQPDPGWDWYVFASLGMAGWALAGAFLVFCGRARGWLVLATATILPLAGLLFLVFLFAGLSAGTSLWWPVLLLIGPLGALVLACQRPVREWTRARPRSTPQRAGRRR